MMIAFPGSRRAAANRAVIERLNAAVVGAALNPAFYLAGGVPDTFNGRFEMLVLHGALVVRRLRAAAVPGPAIAQDLVDLIFRNLDPAMRELGVGDMAVPKRMKRLVEAFLGRSVAYDAALQDSADPATLSETLSRNVYAGGRPAADLAAYVRVAVAALDAIPPAALAAGEVKFPDPAAFLVDNPAS